MYLKVKVINMEQALFLDGTIGNIVPDNMRLEEFWMCEYQGHTFEYHNNLWMEIK